MSMGFVVFALQKLYEIYFYMKKIIKQNGIHSFIQIERVHQIQSNILYR